MKVVYVSAYDSAGQRFNGMVLHRALNNSGHESHYAVRDSKLKECNIHELGSPRLRLWNNRLAKVEKRLSLQANLTLLGRALLKEKYFREAELVHLQLLHAMPFFSLRHIPRIANGSRPVVWTLHDPWITTGHCVHSLGCERWKTGCGKCPDLTIPLVIQKDRTAYNWRLKRRVLRNAKLHLIVASRWMERRVHESPILSHLPCSVIPFGLDRSIFYLRDKAECKKALGLPADARTLAVRWTPHNMLKGTQYAMEALLRLPRGMITHVLCFEAKRGIGLDAMKEKFQAMELGWVETPHDVATALGAADVFIMPSVGETFGMMAVEAMACGTPVIVFEGTSLPEVIESPRAGLAVPYKSSECLADAIVQVLTNETLRQSLITNAQRLVDREYCEQSYIDRHFALYEELLRKK